VFLSEPSRTDYDLNFSIFGFPVRTHPAFFILPILLGRGLIPDTVNTGVGWLLLVAIFFVSILVHELGHAFAYRLFGRDARIVLYWLGGLAISDANQNVWSTPRRGAMDSNQKIIISLAGPIFGFLLAGVFVLAVYLLGGSIIINRLNYIPLPQPDLSTTAFAPNGAIFMVLWSGIILNIVVNLFNLVPIYPLDGGQVARELMTQMDPANGLQNSYFLSIAACIAMLFFSLSIGAQFMAIFFGFMAWSNFQEMQQFGRNPW
jgi:stage IV sporulation protein FB